MAQLVCELCGGTNFVKQDGFFVCQNCGTKYTLEEARKMMSGGADAAQVTAPAASASPESSASDELEKLYIVARRARDDNNNEGAAKYYEMIQLRDPTSWEAAFYTVYFKAMGCKIAEIKSAAISVNNCIESVLTLIYDCAEKSERIKAAAEIVIRCSAICEMLAGAAQNHYNGISSNIRADYYNEYLDRVYASRDTMYNCGDLVSSVFADDDDVGRLACEAWRAGINIHKKYLSVTAKDQTTIDSYCQKIGKYEPEYLLKHEIENLKNARENVVTTSKNVMSKGDARTFGLVALLLGVFILVAACLGTDHFNIIHIAGIFFIGISLYLFFTSFSYKSKTQIEAEKESTLTEINEIIAEKQKELNELKNKK